MPTSDNVFVFDDWVDSPIVDKIWKLILDQPIWQFGWHSRSNDQRYRYWNTNFLGHRGNNELSEKDYATFKYRYPLLDELWTEIEQKVYHEMKVPVQISRVYGNAYTYGTGGTTHVDDGIWTLLYYGTTPWYSDWRGETLFFERDGDKKTLIDACQYIPGRVVLFPAKMSHQAADVSKMCNSVRTIIAFKCN